MDLEREVEYRMAKWVFANLYHAEYAKSKAEMQEWLTAQKIVQTVLGEEEKAKQQHEQEVHQEENR